MTVKELFMKADLKKIAASVAASDWSLNIRNDITDDEKEQKGKLSRIIVRFL